MLSRDDIKKLKLLQKKIRYKFRRIANLHQALTHSSCINEITSGKIKSNETLEFLGDAVLGLVVTEYLYKNYPEYSEGELSIIKSSLVSEPVLAEIAKEIDLGKYLFLGKGEDREGIRARASILSNALEALIAGIYMDRGIKPAVKFIFRIFETRFKNISKIELAGSYKNRLQQYTQSELGCMPVYKVISEKGPSHHKLYEVGVIYKGVMQGLGKGTSKKKAEQEAAKQALAKLGVP